MQVSSGRGIAIGSLIRISKLQLLNHMKKLKLDSSRTHGNPIISTEVAVFLYASSSYGPPSHDTCNLLLLNQMMLAFE